MSPDVLSAVIRSLSFVLLFQAIGAAFFYALFTLLEKGAEPVRRLIRIAAIGAIMAVAAHWGLEATRMTGDFSGFVDASMQHRVMDSSFATAHALQIFGLLLVATSATTHARYGAVFAVAGGTLAISAFLFVGHTSVHPWRAVLGPLLVIHLLIVSFWFGSLLPLLIVVRREPADVTAVVLREFSGLATWLVPLIAIAGLIMTIVIANGIPPPNEPYGALIIAKVAGFAILMGLAGLNKWRLVPAIAANAKESHAALRRSVLAEIALMVCVLSVTAVMTTFFSPIN